MYFRKGYLPLLCKTLVIVSLIIHCIIFGNLCIYLFENKSLSSDKAAGVNPGFLCKAEGFLLYERLIFYNALAPSRLIPTDFK